MKTHKHTSAPRSRRERPAKPALTRQGIIDAALTILREEGLHKVTMRRIAEALDTGPASLYVYVRDTADLHVQILDALLAEVTEPSLAEGTWRDKLKELLTRYSHVLFKYPEIARMTLSRHLSGPNYLALLEQLLALLKEGNMADREAAWVVDLLLLYATAITAEHSTRESSVEAVAEDSALVEAISSSDASVYPSIAQLSHELLSGSSSDRFAWGIDVLLSGAFSTPGIIAEPGKTEFRRTIERQE
ncbi:TetR/AcrR family transcriptional regulator [Ktedonosporobacter rubrisoli]|uniref:TetR/AcrR family transcriptional regulator n=1 Tax=Ktedonosporobacter rubrisoli TaxID=2509675 RepID=A0A4P6JJ74_KTERU|nr:TetR/AcrR family transcriptional regulator [Ktedonosporobacter rubrisoli]QBD75138.1 TetR/AcrR family transcriptional regulator [Ktedonosporobacter rubrisoli]